MLPGLLGITSPVHHPTIETSKNKCLYLIWASRVPPISTQMFVNKIDTARHGLILCQHGATACTDLLETYFTQYRYMFDVFLMEILDFPGTRVSGIEKPPKT